MISTCGIYSLKRNDVCNAPFVALDGEQALSIVLEAVADLPCTELEGVEIWRIGTLHFMNGIVDNEQIRVASAVELLEKRDSLVEEGEKNEVSTSV